MASRRWPDESEARVRAGAGERGVFREKSVAGMHCVASRAARDIH